MPVISWNLKFSRALGAPASSRQAEQKRKTPAGGRRGCSSSQPPSGRGAQARTSWRDWLSLPTWNADSQGDSLADCPLPRARASPALLPTVPQALACQV